MLSIPSGEPLATKNFTYTVRFGQIWIQPGFGGVSAARHYFWDEYQNTLLKKLPTGYDLGWEPITEVGPSVFKVCFYEKNKTPHMSDVILWVVTLGIGFTNSEPNKIYCLCATEFRVALWDRSSSRKLKSGWEVL